MSLSQKHSGKVFVPWFNTAEWKQVYDILEFDKNYNQALTILKIWKNRTPLLSAGVEGTLIILEALLTKNENLFEPQLTQIYAISLMRFLNLCASNSDKQGSFYKTAIKNELPKWLINIRHDIAHDHKLPSISILRLGLHQCLEWIKVKYWQVQNKFIADYVVTNNTNNKKLLELMKIYIELKRKLLSADNTLEYDEDTIEKINDVLFNRVKQPTTDISDILDVLEEYFSDNLQKTMTETDRESVSKTVVLDGLLSAEIEDTGFGVPAISKETRNVWSGILNILNVNNFMTHVLNSLVDVINNIELDNSIRELSSLWIKEIVIALQKIEIVRDELNSIEKHKEKQSNESKVAKVKLSLEENSPEYADCLEFFPTETLCIKDIQTLLEKILQNPNIHTLHFLERLMKLNKSSEVYIADVVNMVKVMLVTDGRLTNTEEIFTTHNLGKICIFPTEDTTKSSEETIVVETSVAESIPATRWKPVKDTTVFKGYPLGVLPHQSSRRNHLLAG